VPLEFNREKTRLSVVASIKYPNRVPFPVRFIVDTGSEDTIIDENIAATVRIFAKNLDFEKFSLLAGTKISYYKLGAVDLTFVDDKGERATLSFRSMKVTGNARPSKASQYIPISLLGMDFFLESGSRLMIDPINDSAYIAVP